MDCLEKLLFVFKACPPLRTLAFNRSTASELFFSWCISSFYAQGRGMLHCVKTQVSPESAASHCHCSGTCNNLCFQSPSNCTAEARLKVFYVLWLKNDPFIGDVWPRGSLSHLFLVKCQTNTVILCCTVPPTDLTFIISWTINIFFISCSLFWQENPHFFPYTTSATHLEPQWCNHFSWMHACSSPSFLPRFIRLTRWILQPRDT